MLHLTEAGQNLVIDYPAWLGLLVIGLGVTLAVHLARHFEWKGKTIGITTAAALLIFGGLYFFTYKVTLEPEGGRVYALPGGSRSIEWDHVVGVGTEQRHGRGTSTWIVVQSAAGNRLEINVTALPGADEQRVREYIAARIKK